MDKAYKDDFSKQGFGNHANAGAPSRPQAPAPAPAPAPTPPSPSPTPTVTITVTPLTPVSTHTTPTTPAGPKPKMTMFRAAKTCFKKYATFSGRASRAEFWWFTLFTSLAVLLAIPEPILGIIYMALFICPWFAVFTRRLHDVGRSGIWVFAIFIYIGWLIPLYFCLRGSQPFPNEYGDEP